MYDTTLAEDLEILDQLRDIEDGAKEAHDIVKRDRERHEAKTFERMAQEKTESQRVDGVLWTPQSTIYSTIQDRAAFIEWAKDYAGETLIEHKERKGELHKLVREKLDNGEGLPPGVGFYTKDYISRRAS